MEAILMPVVILGVTGIVMGVFLAYASKKFEVQRDPKIEAIMAILPGVNCGGCGYPGCMGYACGVVEDGAKTNLCAPGGPRVVAEISKILGVEAPVEEKKKLNYTAIYDETFFKKNKRMMDVYKEALAAKDEDKMAKLEAAAEKTKNFSLEQAYKDIKEGKELALMDRAAIEADIFKKNARLIQAYAAAVKANEMEKADKLYAAAEKTAKGDLINLYEKIKTGVEVNDLPGAPKAAAASEEKPKEDKTPETKAETKVENKEEQKEEKTQVSEEKTTETAPAEKTAEQATETKA